jgi:TonB-linked SusC/RagA family outer membrane protein
MLKIYIIMGRFKTNNATNLSALLMIFLTLFLSGQALAQELKLIRGTVLESSQPLVGASVKVKGSTKSAVSTSNDGKYSIQAKSTDVLVFSFVGMEAQEVLVGSQTTINVSLKEAANSLNELLVIGYQTVKKTDLTGAVGLVKMSELSKAPVSNFAEALAGRVAGVRVSSNDGQPGNTMSIQIRGAASLNNSVQPLYVIDGFATESSESINLNTEDIESMTILKDAASTAVYGSRGTNGVIIIQTKSGKIGKPVIGLSSSYGTQEIIKQIDLMDPYEFVKYQFERNAGLATTTYLTNGKTLESYKNEKGIYWPDQISGTGTIFKNNLSIRGGTEQTKYAISGAGFDQKGVLINTGYKRYQGRIKIDQTISKKLKAGITAEYVDVSAYGMQASATPVSTISSALWFRAWAYRPVNGSNSNFNLEEADADPERITTSDIRLNPRTNAENEHLFNKYTNFNTNLYLNYEITKNLVLRIQGIKNILKPSQERFYNAKTFLGSPSNPNRPNGVFGSILNREVNIWSNENTLTYTNTFAKAHTVTLVAGNSQTSTRERAYGYTSTNLPEESTNMSELNYGITTAPISTSSSNRLSSFFGIIDYNYKSKYYLKGSIRADGSSKFAKQWGYFPTAAVAWSMHNEDFLKNNKVISTSKLRSSFGITGNNRIDDFEWQAQLSIDAGGGYSFNNAPANGAYISGIENRDLKWERTTAKDIGYELGLFKNRIELTVDVYDRFTRDLLVTNAPLAAHIGLSAATKNVGSLRNRGLEISLNTVNIRKKDFSWESNINITFNKTRLYRWREISAVS